MNRLLKILLLIVGINAIRVYMRIYIDPQPVSDVYYGVNNPDADDIVRKYVGKDKSVRSLDGKVILVTGANVGIGLETARSLVHAGATVIIGSRSYEKALAAADDINNNNNKEISPNGKAVVLNSGVQLNLSSLVSIRAFATAFKQQYDKLDILILNAGVVQFFFERTEEGIPATVGVNHIGHFYLTNQLLPLLKKTASESSETPRVIVVSSYGPQLFAKSTTSLTLPELTTQDSSARAFLTNPLRGQQEYAHSKLANVMFARELAKRNPEIRTYSLHPGIIQTDLGIVRYDPKRYFIENFVAQFTAWGQYLFYSFIPFKKTVKQGAATTVYTAIAPEIANETGKYYSDCKEAVPFPVTQDDELSTLLWNFSEHLVSQIIR